MKRLLFFLVLLPAMLLAQYGQPVPVVQVSDTLMYSRAVPGHFLWFDGKLWKGNGTYFEQVGTSLNPIQALLALTVSGNSGFGGITSPAYAVDVNGSVALTNSGRIRVDNAAGVSKAIFGIANDYCTFWSPGNGYQFRNILGGIMFECAEDSVFVSNKDFKQAITSSNVSNPPTDAELDALYTSPSSKGPGWFDFLDDSDSDNAYIVISIGGNWMTYAGTKAL